MGKGYEADSFREAMTRYVPRSEVEERFKELDRRSELSKEAWDEAKNEAEALGERLPGG